MKIILPIFTLIAVFAITAYVINFHNSGISNDTSHWGTFGDYIGGVLGTVFSFTSVLLIYLTFKKQQETSVLQQFESTFFSLLAVQREMMKSVTGKVITRNGLKKTYSGANFFEVLFEELYVDFLFLECTTIEEERAKMCKLYGERFYEAGPLLGPYYRHLYHFLKYTETSDIGKKKKKYMDIVQSQMSDAELYCLFYNAICYGSEKLLPILDNYSFLENIEPKSKSFDNHKRWFYPNTAFKYHHHEYRPDELQ